MIVATPCDTMSRSITISFRGRDVSIELSEGITLDELGQQLESAAHVQQETVKLLLPGRAGKPIKLIDQPSTTALAAGVGTFASAREWSVPGHLQQLPVLVSTFFAKLLG